MATSTISILDFPSEITSLIFLNSFETETSLWVSPEELPHLTPYYPPLIFGCICRQWRSVALSTPELWTTVRVHSSLDIDHEVPFLDRWLLRTGTLPVTLDIHYKLEPSSDGILPLLKRHSHQLQNLTLDLPPDELYRFAGIVGPLPRLAKLVLYSRILNHPSYDGHHISAFNDAPELRDIHFMIGFSPKNIALPWAQLTTFRADTLPISQCVSILSLSPSLVNARFELYHPATVPLISVPPLLHLESLIVRGMVPSTELLAQLTAPALVHLEVEELALDSWTAFLARSQCALQYLAFVPKGWTPAAYLQGLDGISSVTELVIRREGRGFYDLIPLLKDRPNFMPNLKVLWEDRNYRLNRFHVKKGAELCKMVIEMLETRWNSTENSRLEKFELYTTDGLVGSAQLSGRLNALVDDGMKITINGSKLWGR